MISQHYQCDYCGLWFSGSGYSPDNEHRFCCYGCYLVQRIAGAQGDEGIAAWILIRLGAGAFLAMNVMMLSLVLYADSTAALGLSSVRDLHWALLILSTPAAVILAGPFLLAGLKNLRRGRVSTDALILTGSLAAYGVSTLHVIRGSGHVYYDTATMLLLIVTLGRLIEASAKNRTSRAVREMCELTPQMARVLLDGREVDVPCAEVRKGDLLAVKPGERIPADGRIMRGTCLVEESAFTGEARPRSCSPGDTVFGGSVNHDGLITVEATAVGAESLVAQIQEMVLRAQRERAPVERMAERAATAFVPIVWLLALGAAAYWGVVRSDPERAGMSALAVLVVACPCALGIATPIATCLAIGKAARMGVLIGSGEVLERLPSVRRVFLDKTGTLTLNDLRVSEIYVISRGISELEALAWAAPLEAGSEHAIARAIVNAARSRGVPQGDVTDFRVFPGLGVSGTVGVNGDSRRVTVGSLRLLRQEHQVPPGLGLVDDREPLTTAYVGWDGEVRAAISLSDRARPEARGTIDRLRAEGLRIVMISGDREAPTKRLASEIGIHDVLYECTPAEKVSAIRKAREARAGAIAMVGDGINDAPALAEADVGIATGGGADLARQSSDVTLLGDDLSRIPEVLKLARTTYGIIRQNLCWAFGYNLIAICLAFTGLVHPLIAAIAMVGSSLSVIANSMRLLR